MELEPEFEPGIYRRLHSDLTGLNDTELREHYDAYGREEGRAANGLLDRAAFARLVPDSVRALEIGPFASPLLRGPNARYCDVLDQAGLRARALSLHLDGARVPTIHYVLGSEGLDGIPDSFDAVLSSHS